MRVYRWGLAAALLLAALPAARAEDQPPPVKHQSCFSLSDWHGWTADGDQTLYFKVRMHDVYRIDLAEKESFLNAPSMHLITKSWGSDMICNPIDLDLKIADNFGPSFATHLFIKAITKLTPEEIAALPEKDRP
jgi:hypothetical protein